jgi:hypothetical protein
MASRAAFLQDETHGIRFVYTPKHCSWLKQLDFIDFFNQTLAKPSAGPTSVSL